MNALHDAIKQHREADLYVDLADIIDDEYDKRRQAVGDVAASVELVQSDYAEQAAVSTLVKATRRALAAVLGKVSL